MNGGRRASLAAAAVAVALAWCSPGQTRRLTDAQHQALRAIARDELWVWQDLSDDQLDRLRADVEACHDRMRETHLLDGQVVEVRWRTDDRDAVWSYDALGDSANMTGLYLGALVLRQTAEPDTATAAEIHRVLDAFDRLSTVSGRDGYLARFAANPADPADPERSEAVGRYVSTWGRGPSRDRPGMGRWVYPGVAPHDELVWLGYSSRDIYDGAAVGLALAMTRAPSEDARRRARELVLRIGGRLRDDGWRILDGRGHTTMPTASFRLAWMALLAAADPGAHGDLVPARDRLLRTLARRGPRIYPMTYGEYFANVLTGDRLAVLAVTVDDDAGRAALRRALAALMDDSATHLNGHLAAVAALGGLDDDLRVRALVQGLLLDMAPVPRQAGRRGRPVDDTRMDDDGRHASEALLPQERPGTDYLWQRAPLDQAPMRTGSLEYACVDLLLPYWIGRATGSFPTVEEMTP